MDHDSDGNIFCSRRKCRQPCGHANQESATAHDIATPAKLDMGVIAAVNALELRWQPREGVPEDLLEYCHSRFTGYVKPYCTTIRLHKPA